MSDKIYIAKLGKTVGLKGQLKLHIDSDFPEQFSVNTTFKTNKNITLTIESFNKISNVVKFIGLDTIEDATKLINQQLFTSIEDTKQNCKLQKDQYFWFDLENSTIEEEGTTIGTLVEIQRYPQCDYFEIQTSKELVEERSLPSTFLLPYTPQYIIEVNTNDKIIKVQGAFEILEAS